MLLKCLLKVIYFSELFYFPLINNLAYGWKGWQQQSEQIKVSNDCLGMEYYYSIIVNMFFSNDDLTNNRIITRRNFS
jgi:hypothetical protein